VLVSGVGLTEIHNAVVIACQPQLALHSLNRFLTKAETSHIEACEQVCQEFEGQLICVTAHDRVTAIVQVAQEH
jgi:K+-sensing histidine kinase KdpD